MQPFSSACLKSCLGAAAGKPLPLSPHPPGKQRHSLASRSIWSLQHIPGLLTLGHAWLKHLTQEATALAISFRCGGVPLLNGWSPHPNPKGEPIHLLEKTHFCCFNLHLVLQCSQNDMCEINRFMAFLNNKVHLVPDGCLGHSNWAWIKNIIPLKQ